MDPTVCRNLLVQKALFNAMTTRLRSTDDKHMGASQATTQPFKADDISRALSQAIDQVMVSDDETEQYVGRMLEQVTSKLQASDRGDLPAFRPMAQAIHEHFHAAREAGQSDKECFESLRSYLTQNVVIQHLEYTAGKRPRGELTPETLLLDAMLDCEEAEDGDCFVVAWGPAPGADQSAELAALKQQLAAMQRERDALRAQVSQLRGDVQDRDAALARTQAERDGLRAKLGQVTADAERLRAEQSERRPALEAARSDLAAADQRVADLTQRAAAADATAARALGEVATLEQRLAQVTGDLALARTGAASAEQRAQEASDQAEALWAQVDQLAPDRALMDQLERATGTEEDLALARLHLAELQGRMDRATQDAELRIRAMEEQLAKQDEQHARELRQRDEAHQAVQEQLLKAVQAKVAVAAGSPMPDPQRENVQEEAEVDLSELEQANERQVARLGQALEELAAVHAQLSASQAREDALRAGASNLSDSLEQSAGALATAREERAMLEQRLQLEEESRAELGSALDLARQELSASGSRLARHAEDEASRRRDRSELEAQVREQAAALLALQETARAVAQEIESIEVRAATEVDALRRQVLHPEYQDPVRDRLDTKRESSVSDLSDEYAQSPQVLQDVDLSDEEAMGGLTDFELGRLVAAIELNMDRLDEHLRGLRQRSEDAYRLLEQSDEVSALAAGLNAASADGLGDDALSDEMEAAYGAEAEQVRLDLARSARREVEARLRARQAERPEPSEGLSLDSAADLDEDDIDTWQRLEDLAWEKARSTDRAITQLGDEAFDQVFFGEKGRPHLPPQELESDFKSSGSPSAARFDLGAGVARPLGAAGQRKDEETPETPTDPDASSAAVSQQAAVPGKTGDGSNL